MRGAASQDRAERDSNVWDKQNPNLRLIPDPHVSVQTPREGRLSPKELDSVLQFSTERMESGV